MREEFQIAGLDKKVWQYFTVVPDFKSVGVRDNARSFDWPVIIRAVNTVDAMNGYYRTDRMAYPDEDNRPYPERSEECKSRLLLICLRNLMRL